MALEAINELKHTHTFGQEVRKEGESRTYIVIAITLAMMIVEISAGYAFGSIALQADGLHMGSHAAALMVTAFAYIYARKNAANPKFSFGTGKVNALGGYTGAIILAGFALLMVWESVERLLHPTDIAFNWAIAVAFIGLLVNGGCMLILGHHDHGHDDESHHHHHHHDSHHEQDDNLRSAYLHVMADALTSVTAIIALFTAKYFGWLWMDPLMGIVGAILVGNWSISLIRKTGRTLLDHQVSEKKLGKLRDAITGTDDLEITDLHAWSIGPGIYSASVAIVTDSPQPIAAYKSRIPESLGIVHCTVELHRNR